MRVLFVFVAAFFHVVMLTSNVAHAQTSSTASDDAMRARLARVEATLYRDASASQLWYFGWTGFFATVGGAELAVALTVNDRGLRADARVGAFKSGLGVIGTAIAPPPSLFFSPCTAAEKATSDGLAACLARQEQRLEDTAKLERFGRSIVPHIATVAVNVGASLFLWLHDDRLASAILDTVIGITVSEIQIATRPSIAKDVQLGLLPRPGGGVVVATLRF